MLLDTDILWTKPSELSFYAGLGLPIIMAPSVGAQERFNKAWLRAIGAAIPREFKLDIDEVKNPEAHAGIVGYMIAEGLEKRLPFRRVAKQAIEKSMAAKGVQGVKVVLSGRLGGADMGRRESFKAGQVPLTTLRADVDFAREKAYLSYGVIGIKVWIYRGEVFES